MADYIRKADQEIPLTPEQVMEMARLMKRPSGLMRFIHYIDIDTADGPINFGKVIKDFQFDMLRTFQDNDRSIILASRQMSKTTLAAAYLLYEATFPKSKGDILIVAHKQGHSMEVLKRLRDMYFSMPMWMKAGMVKNNETSITFDNGMRVIAEATTANAARGKSLKIVYCDEMSFIPNRIQDEFMAGTGPALSATRGKMIVTSTPNGSRDLFAKIWFNSGMEWDKKEMTYMRKNQPKNEFEPLFVPYWIDPTKNTPEWISREKRTLDDPVKFKVEFECLDEATEVEVYDQVTNEYKVLTLKEINHQLERDFLTSKITI
jgi:phage terminase large subunit-like protein